MRTFWLCWCERIKNSKHFSMLGFHLCVWVRAWVCFFCSLAWVHLVFDLFAKANSKGTNMMLSLFSFDLGRLRVLFTVCCMECLCIIFILQASLQLPHTSWDSNIHLNLLLFSHFFVSFDARVCVCARARVKWLIFYVPSPMPSTTPCHIFSFGWRMQHFLCSGLASVVIYGLHLISLKYLPLTMLSGQTQ